MNLSASIVTYNDQAEAIRAAVSVLEHTRRHPLALYLVDNASTDGTGQALEAAAASGKLAPGPRQTVRVIRKEKNVGFGAGHNTVPTLSSTPISCCGRTPSRTWPNGCRPTRRR